VTQFDQLGLAAPLLKALAAEGYTQPTPIQVQAIPPVLTGRDLIGLAQTGTGKTAAFALPIIQRLAADRHHAGARACRALVLAPTRELASQIADSFRVYGKFIGLSTAVVFGGVPIGKQFRALERGVDILVATPGRLLDLVHQRGCQLGAVEILVLDEADHMLDLGFIHPLRKIATYLPRERQTLFFSATMPPPIAELAQEFLTDPVRVAVAPVAATADRVAQSIIHVDAMKKQDLLHALLQDDSISRALVFARTKHGADKISRRLDEAGIFAEAIHGNKSQGQRERALENFKKGRARLLIATEIAARGIDVDNVTHVINFDLPDVPEQYVHRIGRTARAGAEGRAISFCAPDERSNLRDIERLIKQTVPVEQHALGLAPGERAEERRPARGGRGGQQQRPQGRGQQQRSYAPRQDRDGERPQRDYQERGPQRTFQQARDEQRPQRAHHDGDRPQRASNEGERPQRRAKYTPQAERADHNIGHHARPDRFEPRKEHPRTERDNRQQKPHGERVDHHPRARHDQAEPRGNRHGMWSNQSAGRSNERQGEQRQSARPTSNRGAARPGAAKPNGRRSPKR